MGTLTVVIPDDLLRRLRKHLKERGAGRGALSKFVSSAIERALLESEFKRVFIAEVGGKEVARALSLEELAEILKSKGIDPSTVTVRALPPPKPLARAGARVLERG
ncbi:MAG: hypothetical protein QI197_05520 [Candidatus Korarchaeota archaeon]|nr:hypothetical protein [Candidatus Korarchaeota archaeon]